MRWAIAARFQRNIRQRPGTLPDQDGPNTSGSWRCWKGVGGLHLAAISITFTSRATRNRTTTLTINDSPGSTIPHAVGLNAKGR